MARTKQVAACLICDDFPCSCPGSKPERKPRAKKAAVPKVPTEAPSDLPSSDGVSQDSGGHVASGGSIPPGEGVALPLPPARRKRARFAVAAQPSAGTDDTPSDSQPSQELRFDAEAVAIRNLAHGGLLGPSARAAYAEVIGKPDPDVTRRLAEWRRNRAT